LKATHRFFFPLFFLFLSSFVFSQEWKSLNAYQKETGNTTLQQGCWLKKDRTKQNEVWSGANQFNLSAENGHLKYRTITQIRDFYAWFDAERQKQGHQIQWAGVAQVVASQLSKMDCALIRGFIVRNKEVVAFANEGSKKVFEFAFQKLQKVYFAKDPITGDSAVAWDTDYGMQEQCDILGLLYTRLSPKALHKLEGMAKGKGVFALAVTKQLKYEGEISDCQTRFRHGLKIQAFLKNKKQ
jgi:hypothetical protein